MAGPEHRLWTGGPISRRRFAAGSLIGVTGVAALAAGCSGGSNSGSSSPGNSTRTGSGGATATPKRGGTLTVDAGGGGPIPAVIIFGFNPQNVYIQNTVWDSLIDIGADFKPENRLADTFEMNADYSAVHIKLKQGVVFHDGRPLVADDVAYSIDFFSNKKATGQLKQPLSGGIKDVKVVDSLTLDVTFNGPRPTMVDTFALMSVVDKNTIASVSDFKTMNGTGPFQFVSYTPNQSYVLKRNEHYWEQGKPYLDELKGTPYPDDNARELAVRTGELMHSTATTYKMAADLKGASGVQLVDGGSGGTSILGLTVDQAPFTDPRVRQAVSFALNRDRMAQTWGHGLTQGAILPWPVGSPGYFKEDAALVSYQPDKAKQLLSQAGASGAAVTITVPAGQPLADLAVYAQNDLNTVGFSCQLKPIDNNIGLQQLRSRTFPTNAWMGTHGFGDYSQPGTMVTTAQQFIVPNASHYNPPGYEQLVAQLAANAAGTPQETQLIHQWNKEFLEDPWLEPLVYNEGHRAMSSKLNGDVGKAGGRGIFRPADWWLS